MEVLSSIETPLIGERRRFVDACILSELGYTPEFLFYANTEWEVIKVTTSWRTVRGSTQYYFDLMNEKGIVLSSIADEVLIKI